MKQLVTSVDRRERSRMPIDVTSAFADSADIVDQTLGSFRETLRYVPGKTLDASKLAGGKGRKRYTKFQPYIHKPTRTLGVAHVDF